MATVKTRQNARGAATAAGLVMMAALVANCTGNPRDAPLAAASSADDVNAAVAAGANVNAKVSLGMTALQLAAYKGRPEVARALLAAGAHVDDPYIGQTPLLIAVQRNHADVAQVLLDGGADINGGPGHHATPLAEAEKDKFNDIAAILRARGAHD